MSIVENAKNVCKEDWIVHECGSGDICSSVIGRGKGNKRISILLEGAPVPHIVVDLDKISSSCLAGMEIGDYMIMIDRNRRNTDLIVSIEISHGKSKKASKIARQIESSITFALSHIATSDKIEFVLVFVGNTREAKELLEEKIKLFGKVYTIHIAKSKEKIDDIIQRYLRNRTTR